MKRLVKSLLVSGIILVSLSTTVTSYAADATSDIDNGTGKTNVQATFTKGDQIIQPLDPNGWNEESATVKGHNGAKAGGSLSLIYVTNTLDFGSHAIDVLKDQSIPANYTDSNNPDNNAKTDALVNDKSLIEVSDVRGTNTGWNLKVKGSPLVGADQTTIDGASLELPDGKVSSPSNAGTGAESSAVKNALDSNGALVLSAGIGKGGGITADELDPANIKLNIPANQAKAQGYSTNLEWTLSASPAS